MVEVETKPTNTGVGKIAQDYLSAKLRKQNYYVLTVDFTNEKVISTKNRMMIDKIQSAMLWEDIETKRIKEVIKIIKENIIGFPDLFCINKDTKEISFIEVKANKSHLSETQKNTIKRLRQEGFKVDVRYFNVICEVNEIS